MTNNIPIPSMNNPTLGNIKQQIKKLLATGGYANMDVRFNIAPADASSINVNLNLFEDQTNDLLKTLYQEQGFI